MKKHFIFLLLLAFLLSACISQPDDAALEPTEFSAARADLTVAIEASGTIRSAQTAYLLWQTSGTIENTYFSLGDYVQTDDILADLETTSLPQHVILAEANLNSAKDAAEAVEDAYGELAQAQAASAITAAQDTLASAQQQYDSTSHIATEAQLQQAYNKMVLTEKQWLDMAEQNRKVRHQFDQFAKLNALYGEFVSMPRLGNTTAAQMNAGEAAAEAKYNAAKDAYENLVLGPDPDDVALATANVQLAQMQVIDAQSEYERILAGAPADDLAAAAARVAAAQITLDQANVQVPFNGTITLANWLPGDQVNPGEIAYRIDDISNLYIDAFISETNVSSVMIGQRVEINPDATPGQTYMGEIVALSPVGESNGGLVTFKAEILILDADTNVRPGMSVDIRIVLEIIEQALIVPSRAIRLYNNERVVYVKDTTSGEVNPVVVELGLTIDGMVQIKSGELDEGDLVIITPEEYKEEGGIKVEVSLD